MDTFLALQHWYHDNCDGDWEHQYGIKIETLDNPGWWVEIDLIDTTLESRAFEPIKIERNDLDWINCCVEKSVFKGYGGPKNLREILGMFVTWAVEVTS